MNNTEIVALLRKHERGQDYYDPVLNRTQWLCGCREWVYDHPQHVADELVVAVDLRLSACPCCGLPTDVQKALRPLPHVPPVPYPADVHQKASRQTTDMGPGGYR